MTLGEVADLTKYLEDKLGVTPMAAPMGGMPMMAPGMVPAGGDAAPEEAAPVQTEFTVKLTGFDDKSKIKLIKELRGVVEGLGMKEAKEMVEKSPSTVKGGLSKEAAEEMKAKLEGAGGKVELE